METSQKVTLALVLLTIASPGSTSFLLPSIGKLTPRDPTVCIGDNLIMTCILSNVAKGNASNLIFTRNGNAVEADSTDIVGTMKKVLTIRNVDAAYNGSFIRCCLDDCTDYTKTVGSQILHITGKPVNVTEFRCVAYDWDFSLTCDWILQKMLDQYDNFTCSWHYNGLDMPSLNSCPTLSIHDNKTFVSVWNGSNQQYFDGKELLIQLDWVNSVCGETVHQVFNVSVSNIVKPAPVHSLYTANSSSSCISLVWSHNKTYRSKDFLITYQATNGRGGKWMEISVQITMVTICQLYPYTYYEFKVKVHPHGNHGFWSEPVKTAAKTLSDAPARAPQVVSSNFQSEQTDCPTSGSRQVKVYWTPLSEFEANGPITLIRATVTPPLTADSAPYIDINDSDAQITLTLQCDQRYSVSLQAYNDEGFSQNSSTLHIPRSSTDLPVANFRKIEMELSPKFKTGDNITVILEWQPLPEQQVGSLYSYYFYWCPKSAGLCTGEPKWTNLSSDVTSHAFISSRPEEYIYGIAMETNSSKSAGITWEDCVYTKGADPGPVTDIQVTPGADDNTLHVKWQQLPCRSGSPYITGYRLYHCLRMCSAPLKDYVSIQANRSSWILKDLLASKEYDIRLQAITGDKEGLISDPVFGTPQAYSFPVPAIVVIVVAGVIFLVGIGFGIRGCYRNYRRMDERAKANAAVATFKILSDLENIKPEGGNGHGYRQSHSNLVSAKDEDLDKSKKPRGQLPEDYTRAGPPDDLSSSISTSTSNSTTPILDTSSTTSGTNTDEAHSIASNPSNSTTPYIAIDKAHSIAISPSNSTTPYITTDETHAIAISPSNSTTPYITTDKVQSIAISPSNSTTPYITTDETHAIVISPEILSISYKTTDEAHSSRSQNSVRSEQNEHGIADYLKIEGELSTQPSSLAGDPANARYGDSNHGNRPPISTASNTTSYVTHKNTGYIDGNHANKPPVSTASNMTSSMTPNNTGYVDSNHANKPSVSTANNMTSYVTSNNTGYVDSNHANIPPVSTANNMTSSVTPNNTGYVDSNHANIPSVSTANNMTSSVTPNNTGYVDSNHANKPPVSTANNMTSYVTSNNTGYVDSNHANIPPVSTANNMTSSVTPNNTGYVDSNHANKPSVSTANNMTSYVTPNNTRYVDTPVSTANNMISSVTPNNTGYVDSNHANIPSVSTASNMTSSMTPNSTGYVDSNHANKPSVSTANNMTSYVTPNNTGYVDSNHANIPPVSTANNMTSSVTPNNTGYVDTPVSTANNMTSSVTPNNTGYVDSNHANIPPVSTANNMTSSVTPNNTGYVDSRHANKPPVSTAISMTSYVTPNNTGYVDSNHANIPPVATAINMTSSVTPNNTGYVDSNHASRPKVSTADNYQPLSRM